MKKQPRYLYKYMSKCLDRIGDVIVNRRLYFANPLRFKDPFDCALGLDLHHGATTQDWVDYFIHLVGEETPDSTAEYRRAKAEDNVRRGRHKDLAFVREVEATICQAVEECGQELGVLCLSSDLKNIMMWAHYSDNHEGLILRFDSQHMRDQASGEFRCFQVKYNLFFPRLPEYLAALLAFKNGDQRAFAKLFFCRKSRDWKYEKEWRCFTSKPGSFVEFSQPMLSGIIFGWKMPESTRKLVSAWTASLSPQPKLFQSELYKDRFQMEITRMTL